MQQVFRNLRLAIAYVMDGFYTYGSEIKSTKWQGIKAEKLMFELDNVYFEAQMPATKEELIDHVQPHLPWADEHFAERVDGIPTNPGEAYKRWPFYPKDDRAIKPTVFTHTYQERFWPKHAGELQHIPELDNNINRGIRFPYGDLNDVVKLLATEPFTRQAYLPIFFPEDTGAGHGGRIPCTLGYLFMRRGDRLNITYYIRSCDFIRHFRDDVYFTVMLTYWMLDQLEEWNHPEWGDVKPGVISMHIGSLHVWSSERNLLKP